MDVDWAHQRDCFWRYPELLPKNEAPVSPPLLTRASAPSGYTSSMWVDHCDFGIGFSGKPQVSGNRLLGISIAAIFLLLPHIAAAAPSNDRVQIGRSIVVQRGENVGDLVCIACSIRVRGQTAGDAVAVAGSISLEDGAQIAGDSVAVAGSVRLESNTKVGGDVVAVAGKIHRDPEAVIGGDVTSVGGVGWMVPILLAPFLFLGAIIALIIWLVQRNRQTSPATGYPAATPTTRS